MFRQRTEEEYAASSEVGERQLFTLGPYRFHDTLDEEGRLHHFVEDAGEDDEGCRFYELDAPTMYEFMARFLAGLHEMEEYALDSSPGHGDLLDVLEITTARARGGEHEFSWEEFDPAETEILNDEDGEYVEEERDEEDRR